VQTAARARKQGRRHDFPNAARHGLRFFAHGGMETPRKAAWGNIS
jgi:hypothetical protein